MSNNNIPADVLAAIAMALYEIQDQVHDVESNILTINRVSQFYSPWSAKENNMLKMPDKK